VRLISKEDFDSWTRKTKPKAGDIIMTRRARVGDIAVVPDNLVCAIGQNLVILRSDGKQLDQSYLRWVLRGPLYEEQKQKFLNVGAVFDSLNCGDIPKFEIPVPTLPEQRAIAAILGALDDKIELNRCMNRTLEAMARAIFTSWFVDFDPVRAKMEGHPPFGMDADTAALFPDAFEGSPVGDIPHGWKIVSIADLADYVNGKPFTKYATGTGRMVIRIAELNSGPGASTQYSNIDASPENTAYPDDILFAWSGSLDVYRWHGEEAIINQHIFKVIPHDLPNWFVYYHLRFAMPFFQSIAAHKATTMGHIQRHHLSEYKVTLPSKHLLDLSNLLIGPVYSLIHANEQQSRVLAAIRDSLLPHLLSGETKVEKAEVPGSLA